MRLVRTALEFGMELYSDIEIVFGNLDGFDDVPVGGGTADQESRI